MPVRLLYLALAAASCLTGLAVRAQDAGDGKTRAAAGAHRREMPVVDFTASDDPADARLRAKSRRYDLKDGSVDKSGFVLKESDPEELFELPGSHAPERSAIPAAQSDVVVIGQVLSGAARLSNDRTGVYSEFDLQVEEVLKDTSGQGVGTGSSLTAERRGGAVRFPSGKVLRRSSLLETMPLAGERYVMFLRSRPEDGSYAIVTGYNLRGGEVFPLDGVDLPGETPNLRQFAAYDGVVETEFLNNHWWAIIRPPARPSLSANHTLEAE